VSHATADYLKPLPLITPLNEPFWLAARSRELRLQRCRDCGSYVWPISILCQSCWSRALGWERVSGRGRLSSWIVYHRPFHPAFTDDVPYNVVEVELEEGPRLQSSIVGLDVADFREHLPVEAIFDNITDRITLIRFKPRIGEE
jgi:uncharacterized OB-fold protein